MSEEQTDTTASCCCCCGCCCVCSDMTSHQAVELLRGMADVLEQVFVEEDTSGK